MTRREICAIRYCSEDTFAELFAGGRCEAEAGHERTLWTYSPQMDAFTQWEAVKDDDPRLNTVVLDSDTASGRSPRDGAPE